MSTRASTLLAVLLLGACQPSFAEDEALVTTPRVLAVKSEPAEGKPGSSLTFSAFVALPPSGLHEAPLVWSFCSAPKPPTEDNAVAAACLEAGSLRSAGQGATVLAQIPSNACVLFGPNAASVGSRPRDADATGGYFQPLRVDLQGVAPTFHLQRVLCGLADASAEIATTYGAAYEPNQNPKLLPLTATIDGQSIDLAKIPRGARVDLEVAWSPDNAEQYAFFDRAAQAVTTRREALSVAWHVSAGKLETESSGRSEDDSTPFTTNTWTAPSDAHVTKIWLVLRDSRGGTDFADYDLTTTR